MLVQKIILSITLMVLLACNGQTTVPTYQRVNENSRWGYMNENNEMVIAYGLYDFLNEIDEAGMILATKNGKHGYIDIQQNIIIPFEYDDLGVFTAHGLAPAQKNGKMGFINRKGDVVVAFIYDHLGYFYKSGLAIAMRDGKQGFINEQGKEVIPLIYEDVNQSMDDEIILISKEQKWALFTNTGLQITPFKYDQIGENSYGPLFISNRAIATVNNKFTFLTKEGKELINPGTYTTVLPFTTSGFSIVSKNNKFGIITTEGTEIIDLDYDAIEHPTSYSNILELFILKKNHKISVLNAYLKPIVPEALSYEWDKIKTEKDFMNVLIIQNSTHKFGVVKEDGTELIPFVYESLDGFDGKTVAIAKRNGKFGIVDAFNNEISAFVNDTITRERFSDQYVLKTKGLYRIVAKDGTKIKDFTYDDMQACYYDEENQFIVKKDNKYGMVAIDGTILIPVMFDDISNWVEYGPEAHFVTKAHKKGMYSRTGKELIPPIYEELMYYTATCIVAEHNKKVGVIDLNNKTIIPFQYDEILVDWFDTVMEHKAPEFFVLKNNTYQQIDGQNKVIRTNISKKEIDKRFYN